jgi:hypothetical protein
MGNSMDNSMVNSKECYACKDVKVRSEFHTHIRNKDGLDSYCKSCRNVINRRRRNKNHYNDPVPDEYVDPSAPEDFGKGRRCEWCRSKVSRYQTPVGHPQILLCYPCQRVRVNRLLENGEAPRLSKSRGRQAGRKLPGFRTAYKNSGISMDLIAHHVGVKRDHLRRVVSCEKGLALDRIPALAQILGVDEEELYR